MVEGKAHQKYVDEIRKICLLDMGLLILKGILLICLIWAPMFTYEVAGVKGKFSLFDDFDLFLKKLEVVNNNMTIKEGIIIFVPLLLTGVFMNVPYMGWAWGIFGNKDSFAYGKYYKIKEKAKNNKFSDGKIAHIVSMIIGIIGWIIFIWYVKDKKIGGYFCLFNGINFFGVLYLLLTAAGYVLFFYLKKEYDFIKKQIEEE